MPSLGRSTINHRPRGAADSSPAVRWARWRVSQLYMPIGSPQQRDVRHPPVVLPLACSPRPPVQAGGNSRDAVPGY